MKASAGIVIIGFSLLLAQLASTVFGETPQTFWDWIIPIVLFIVCLFFAYMASQAND